MAHKHSEGSPCECEKLKNAEREELREGLKKCTEAREADRRAREEENAKRATDAEAEVKSLKKKLIAFQLATAVGVAVVGQEVFDKITAKMNAVQEVQQKITGEGTPPAEPAIPEKQADSRIGSPLFSRPWQKPNKSSVVQEQGNGDISGIFAGGYKSKDEPLRVLPSVTPPTAVDEAFKKITVPPTVADAVSVAEPFNPYAFFLTPSALPFDEYSTGLALGNNYGFGEYYGTNTGGAVAPPVPSPAPLTVFAVGGLMQSRKRA
jgi:hypothetical protein